MLNKLKPTIAIIDSGIGGISILRELIKLNPTGNYIYFADNKFMPYGKRSYKCLKKRVEQLVDMMNDKYCVDTVILACNTASSVIDKSKYNNLLYMEFDKSKTYLATKLTKESNPEINIIMETNMASEIEKKITNKKALDGIVARHVKKNKLNELKEFTLGCTHYELVKELYQKHCPNTKIECNSKGLIEKLDVNKYIIKGETKPTVVFLTSKPSKTYEELLRKLAGV